MRETSTKRNLSSKRRKSTRQSQQKKTIDKPVRKPVATKKHKPANDSVKQVNRSRKPSAAMKAKVKRKNGRILPGSGSNGGGRPKGAFSTLKTNELQAAISRVELTKDATGKKRKKWLDHQIAKSYDDTTIAVALLGKMHASLKSVEQISIGPDSVDIQEAEEIQKEMQVRCKTKVTSKKKSA